MKFVWRETPYFTTAQETLVSEVVSNNEDNGDVSVRGGAEMGKNVSVFFVIFQRL